MTFQDRFGLTLSTTSSVAADAYRTGYDFMLAAWPGTAHALDAAIAADPDFALAYAARARVHATYMQGSEAKAAIAKAQAIAARRGDDREKSHVEVLALGIMGQPAKSLEAALAHTDHWPRDAMILNLMLGAFGLYAFSGRSDHDQARVDLCDKHAAHYREDWWFLGYRGWSHTENGAVGFGRTLTERSLALKRENANSAHALAHAMFEDGSADDAERFMDNWLPLYRRDGLLHGHLAWHQTLVALERGDTERALNIYRDRIALDVTQAAPLNAITDGAALLWRVYVAGGDVPASLWTTLETEAERRFPQAGVTFADVHLGLIAAGTNNRAALDKRIAELDERLKGGKLAAGAVVPATCRAASAFKDGDYARTIALLEPFAADVVRIGGSHAQRELIEDMLLVAYMRGGRPKQAIALLDQRLHKRPSARDTQWRSGLSA